MVEPQISVIVPVYNTEKYLHRCIDSILFQTYTDFELLLIDDGSTDSSGTICDEYAEKDSRVRVFHKANGGVSSARNLGLDNAQGEWITFVDADDELVDENSLQILYNPISHNSNIELSVCGYECYDVDGLKTFSTASFDINSGLDVDNTISMAYGCSYYQFYSIAKLYKTSIIKKYSIRFDEKIYFSEDRLFIIQYICHCERNAYFSSLPIYKYLLRTGGAMSSLSESFNYKSLTGFTAAIKMLEILQEVGTSDKNIKLAQKDVMTSYAITLANLNQYRVNDHILRKELRMRLHKALPISTFILFMTKRVLRKILKK